MTKNVLRMIILEQPVHNKDNSTMEGVEVLTHLSSFLEEEDHLEEGASGLTLVAMIALWINIELAWGEFVNSVKHKLFGPSPLGDHFGVPFANS